MSTEDTNQEEEQGAENSGGAHGAESHSHSDEDFHSHDSQNQEQQQDNGADESNRRGPINFGKGEDPTKINFETNPGEIINGTWGFLRSILSLRNDKYNVPAVVEGIKSGIEFKGYNVWILTCSILVASVGLNIDSTAVVVGAMLISPLMGPIRGIGFGVAMNDFRMLISSVQNFGVTVGISIFVASVYFWISPLDNPNAELMGRTSPTFMDVVIAFFGGLAGVIAATKGRNDTVIPGVAIATALMPPLCTVGFCMAQGMWTEALGAMYLFLLNSLLIALSTILFVRYLKFPKKEYLTPKIERRVTNYTIIFMVVIVAPSGYLFYEMAKRSIFESNAEMFVKEIVETTNTQMEVDPTYDWENRTIHLEVSYFHVDSSQKSIWSRQLSSYDLDDAKINVKQDRDIETLINESFQDFDIRNQGVNTLAEALSRKDQKLYQLIDENNELRLKSKGGNGELDLDHTIKGFHVQFPEINYMSIDKRYTVSNQGRMDTTFVLNIGFDPTIAETEKEDISRKVSDRLLFDIREKTTIRQDSLIINRVE